MNEYDVWSGLTGLTPVAYLLSIGIMAGLFWMFGAFRDK